MKSTSAPIAPRPAPVLSLDSQKIEAFEGLFLEARRLGPAAFIDYNIPYPKHEFLRYLVEQKQILLHGSNYPDVKVLLPMRFSFDVREAMNGQTIFAAADGIFPMFFAILDRKRYVGTMSNGAYQLPDATGLPTSHYFFSINEEMLESRPFRRGTIYLLPKDKFKPAADGQDVLLEEWISWEPVEVLAKLSISPEDFPLLDAVWGHNESELLWLGENIKICLGAVEDNNELQSGYCFRFPGGDEWATRLAELCRLQQKFCPFLIFELLRDSSNGPLYLQATGPDGAKQAIRSLLGMYSSLSTPTGNDSPPTVTENQTVIEDLPAASASHLASWELFIDELERKILPFYLQHELTFDRYGVHGRMHICRSVMLAEGMARFYRMRTKTMIDFFAVRVAVAFHDSGRRDNGVDIWESDSAANCIRYVAEAAGEGDYAYGVGALIEKNKKSADSLKTIVQDADVLEIMRPCCGHGGLAGFRRQFLHFGGPDDMLARDVPDIAMQREALIQEAWRWILSTERLKAFFADSPTYMRDLLKHLERQRLKFPLLSGWLLTKQTR